MCFLNILLHDYNALIILIANMLGAIITTLYDCYYIWLFI